MSDAETKLIANFLDWADWEENVCLVASDCLARPLNGEDTVHRRQRYELIEKFFAERSKNDE